MVPSPEPALGVMLPMWPSRRPSKPRREASQGESHDCTSLEAGAQACRPLADLAYGIPLAVPQDSFFERPRTGGRVIHRADPGG